MSQRTSALLGQTLVLACAAVAAPAATAAVGSLHPGRYIGYLTQPNAPQKIAITFDIFAFKPDDPAAFPVQRAILKVSIGGLQSREYVTEVYDNIQFDFTDGIISMGAASNDISINGKVTSPDVQSYIDGNVFIRSAATSAQIHLVELSDDIDADPGTLPGDQYRPLLSGAYEGTCGGHQATLQIEVARGLDAISADHHGLSPYRIVGRLGMHEEAGCTGSRFCTERSYHSGTFDIFRSRLILNASNGPDDCQASGDGMSCNVHLGVVASHCELKRKPLPIVGPTYYARTEFIATTPQQMAKLPDMNPPSNAELVAALKGDFIGYLHHQDTNHYQVFRMNLMAYSSTDNPHNENLVYISGASVLHFGKAIADDFFVQQFEPHSFYLVPGFTLSSDASDGFIRILDWRQGYIRGMWYSRAYGEVGTVELIKGTTLPLISDHAKFVPTLAGAYIGPSGSPGDGDYAWWFNFLVPTQAPTIETSTLELRGQYQLRSGATARHDIDHGAFDFYSGAIAWDGGNGSVVTGLVADGPVANLFWPGIDQWGVELPFDHNLYPYAHQ